jgi:dTDP-4-dehydrorhamnose reductase
VKILVAGFPGLLSGDLVPILQREHEVIPLTLQDLDITQKAAVFLKLETLRPDILVNCAGYTQVDRAEKEADEAFRVNALGVHHLALACQAVGTVLCQISTDYVFDGGGSRPYQPWDATGPVNVYGASKLAGEFYTEHLLNRFYIVRTSSLYGSHGPNFVRMILDRAWKGDPLSVVTDQIMSPTWSVNLSRGILRIIASGNFGTYHLTDRTDGGIRWSDFAREILKVQGIKNEVLPIHSRQLARPAQRPAYSVLDMRYTNLISGYQPLAWQEALGQFLDKEITIA